MTRQDFINRLLLMLMTGKELEDGVLLALEQCGMKIVPADDDPLRWPIQAEGIGLILTEALNIPEIAAKIAKAIQSGNY